MDLQDLFIPGVTALATIAVSWGVIRTEVSGMRETLKELQRAHEDLKERAITKEQCRESHNRADKQFDELKSDIKEIKNMMTKLFIKIGIGNEQD